MTRRDGLLAWLLPSTPPADRAGEFMARVLFVAFFAAMIGLFAIV